MKLTSQLSYKYVQNVAEFLCYDLKHIKCESTNYFWYSLVYPVCLYGIICRSTWMCVAMKWLCHCISSVRWPALRGYVGVQIPHWPCRNISTSPHLLKATVCLVTLSAIVDFFLNPEQGGPYYKTYIWLLYFWTDSWPSTELCVIHVTRMPHRYLG